VTIKYERADREIERLSERLSLPEIAEENAKIIYRNASGFLRGRGTAALAAASVYASCRKNRIPRTLDEILNESPTAKKNVTHCYRLFLREGVVEVPVANSLACFSGIAAKAKVSQRTRYDAFNILREARKRGYDRGKDPFGSIAGALYVSCLMNKERKKEKEIAKAAGVAETTVRNRYKALMNVLGLDLDDYHDVKRRPVCMDFFQRKKT
jgi:transcription initiation factor TFIIB